MHKPLRQVSGVSGANRQHRTGANLVEHTPGTILSKANYRKRKLTAVCSHQTRIGNLDAHLI